MHDVGARTRMVGRATELEALRRALEEGRSGHPRGVVVRGEAGIGKTRLLNELIADATAQRSTPPLAVAVGHCVDLGPIGAPFTPIRRLLNELLRAVGEESFLRAAGTPFAQATLRTLVPELDAPDPAPADGPAYVSEAVERLLENLSVERHLLLVIEDLHWADEASLALVRTLASSLRSTHLTFVLTYRSDDVGRGHPLRAMLAELDRNRSVTGIELSRLADTETAQLAQDLLGDVSASDLAAIHARSSGIPFFVEEVAGLRGSAMPSTLRDLVLARYERLGDRARSVTRALAVGGVSVEHGLLTEVTASADSDGDALREAVSENVLVISGDAVSFRHALIREAVYDDLLPSERTALHRAYAHAFERRVDAGGDVDAVAVTEHWLRARNLDRAFDSALIAMRSPHVMASPSTRVRVGEQILELWPSIPDADDRAGMPRGRFAAAVSDLWGQLGDSDRAIRTVREALASPEALPNAVQADLYRSLSAALFNYGLAQESADAAATGLSLLPSPREPWQLAVKARLLSQHAERSLSLADQRQALEHASALARESGDERTLADCVLDTVMVTSEVDLVQARELARELPSLTAKSVRAHDAVVVIDLLNSLGQWDEAAHFGESFVRAATDMGVHSTEMSFVTTNVGESLIGVGRAAEGREHLRKAIPALGGSPAFRSYARRLLAVSASWDDDPDEARRQRQVEAALLDAVCQGDPEEELGWAEADLEVGLNEIDSLRIDVSATRTLRDNAAILGSPSATARLLRRVLPGAARLAATLAHAGHRDTDLEAAVRDALRRQLVDPLSAAVELLALAELAYAAGDASAQPWETVRNSAAFGNLHIRHRLYVRFRALQADIAAGDRSDAARRIDELIDDARAGGVSLVARWTTDLAARSGVAAGGRGAARTAPTLTPRELQVLRLVADGLTNSQIGQQLFISPKTASVHVSAILAKVGAANRAEAAARFHTDFAAAADRHAADARTDTASS